jgi:hypothetical protein
MKREVVMAVFLKTGWNSLINADSIERIHEPAEEQADDHLTRATAVLKNGERVKLDPTLSVAEIEVMCLPVVPANPGFVLLNYWGSEADDSVSRIPIVAWKISGDTALPVVPDEMPKKNGYVLYPDGQVCDAFNTIIWESEEKWLEEMREQEAEKRRKNAAQ